MAEKYVDTLMKPESHWKRISDLPNSQQLVLFSETLSPYNAIQGTLPDCFLITACTVLAARPQLLKNLFVTKTYNSKGEYICQFYRKNAWIQVTIDDFIPMQLDRPIYARSKIENEIWPMILEKAYAKFYNSYDNIVGGNVSEALVDLTGFAVEDYNLEREDVKKQAASGELWKLFTTWKDKKYLIACTMCTGDDVNLQNYNKTAFGIIENHAYAILDVKQVKMEHYLLIHNPHGGDAIKSERGLPDPGDGSFWIKFSSFMKVFNRVYCCKVPSEPQTEYLFDDAWTSETAGGSSTYPSFRKNPKYIIELSGVSTESLFITIGQESKREQKVTSNRIDYPQLGFTIVKLKDKQYNPSMLTLGNYESVLKTSFWNKREVSHEFSVNTAAEGSKFILVPSTYFPAVQTKFYLLIRANKSLESKLKIHKYEADTKSIDISGAWKGQSAGGSTSFPSSFVKNPSYYLAVQEACEITYFLEQPSPNSHDHTGTSIAAREGTSKRTAPSSPTKKPMLSVSKATISKSPSKPSSTTKSPVKSTGAKTTSTSIPKPTATSSSKKLLPIGLLVFQNLHNLKAVTGNTPITHKCVFTNAPCVSGIIKISTPGLYMAVPCTMEPNCESSYKLSFCFPSRLGDKVSLVETEEEAAKRYPEYFQACLNAVKTPAAHNVSIKAKPQSSTAASKKSPMKGRNVLNSLINDYANL